MALIRKRKQASTRVQDARLASAAGVAEAVAGASSASKAPTSERARSERAKRPSGVRRVASKAQTPRVTAPDVPIAEVLYCLAMGDEIGALASGEVLLHRAYVPYVRATPRELRDASVDARARWLIAFIDGETPLPRVLESSALPTTDALHAICELISQKVVLLRQ